MRHCGGGGGRGGALLHHHARRRITSSSAHAAAAAADFKYFSPLAPNRIKTGSEKWDRYNLPIQISSPLRYADVQPKDVIPAWVADMDFQAPPNVLQALRARVDHGVFGYAHATSDVYTAIRQRHGLASDDQGIIVLPGLVVALNVLARALAAEGEAIMTTTPVYPPFFTSAKNQARSSAQIPLVTDASGVVRMDLDAMHRRCLEKPSVKALLLCSPHNPTGRVWTRDELLAVVDLCRRHALVLVSDEVHCDLVLSRRARFVSALGLGYDDRLVLLHSPSKTFNLAGLGCAYAVIPDVQLRAKVRAAAKGVSADVNALAYPALVAAYSPEAELWRRELVEYLRGNADFLASALRAPVFAFSPPEATYLAWIDATRTGRVDVARALLDEAGVAVNDGATFFGEHPQQGRGWFRLNFACARDTLERIVDRLERWARSGPR